MQKQGAIILATGGDESNSAMGKFYEGIMVLGAYARTREMLCCVALCCLKTPRRLFN